MIKHYFFSKFSLILVSLVLVITVLHKTGVLENYYPKPIFEEQSVAICIPYFGLGNQIYRYAAAYNFSKRHNLKLWAKLPQIGDREFTSDKRFYALDKLGIKFEWEISEEMFAKIPKERIVRVEDHNFYDIKLEPGKFYIFDGLYESPFYYEERVDEILGTMDFESNEPDSEGYNFWKKKILETPESSFVHVRRGDFGTRVMPIESTFEFMEEMRKQKPGVHFFVFTDQPDAVKNLFKEMKDITFVSDGTLSSLEEFFLMRLTKNGVLANSTFSYWVSETSVNRMTGLFIAPNPKINKIFISDYKTPYGPEVDEINLKIFLEQPYPKRWKTIHVPNW